MPTIRQLIQTSPAKANELFAKLAETSGNAVKTRERLFSELKEELDADAPGGAAPLPGSQKAQGDEGSRRGCAQRQQRDPQSSHRAGAHPEREQRVRQQSGRAAQGVPAACAGRAKGTAACCAEGP